MTLKRLETFIHSIVLLSKTIYNLSIPSTSIKVNTELIFIEQKVCLCCNINKFSVFESNRQ